MGEGTDEVVIVQMSTSSRCQGELICCYGLWQKHKSHNGACQHFLEVGGERGLLYLHQVLLPNPSKSQRCMCQYIPGYLCSTLKRASEVHLCNNSHLFPT